MNKTWRPGLIREGLCSENYYRGSYYLTPVEGWAPDAVVLCFPLLEAPIRSLDATPIERGYHIDKLRNITELRGDISLSFYLTSAIIRTFGCMNPSMNIPYHLRFRPSLLIIAHRS